MTKLTTESLAHSHTFIAGISNPNYILHINILQINTSNPNNLHTIQGDNIGSILLISLINMKFQKVAAGLQLSKSRSLPKARKEWWITTDGSLLGHPHPQKHGDQVQKGYAATQILPNAKQLHKSAEKSLVPSASDRTAAALGPKCTQLRP